MPPDPTRIHLPKLGLLALILLLGLDLSLRPWDVRTPSWVRTGVAPYVVILLILSIAPGYAIGLYLYYKDLYFDESWRLLGRIFLLGMLLAPVAGMGEMALGKWLFPPEKNWGLTENFAFYFFVVALLEELVKFAAVYRLVYRSHLFKQVFDGVLFCAASALGFAILENLIYVLTSGKEALGVALMRALTAVPGHVADGIIMGYGMGKAREARGKPEERQWLLLGLGGAIAFHGLYDFALQLPGDMALLFLLLLLVELRLAYWAMKKGLRYSPFTRCGKCRQVMPQLVSHCPQCGGSHRIELKCWSCGRMLDKWNRRCARCGVGVHFPWHLRIGRLKDFFPRSNFVPCPQCREEIPRGTRYCLHCGRNLAHASQ